jgi:hypothetical protein
MGPTGRDEVENPANDSCIIVIGFWMLHQRLQSQQQLPRTIIPAAALNGSGARAATPTSRKLLMWA